MEEPEIVDPDDDADEVVSTFFSLYRWIRFSFGWQNLTFFDFIVIEILLFAVVVAIGSSSAAAAVAVAVAFVNTSFCPLFVI